MNTGQRGFESGGGGAEMKLNERESIWQVWGNKRKNTEEMKKHFLRREKNGTKGGCVKESEKSS